MMKKQQFTNMRDIARLAGVSIATVSRVINAPETVAYDRRERILRVMREYEYIPSQVARNNFAQYSNTIMFLATDIGHPFNDRIIKKLNDSCFEKGYALFACNVGDDRNKEQKYYEYCVANRCAGMVYAMGVSRMKTAFHLRHDIPVVVIDGNVDISENYMSIGSDDQMMLDLLVDHLVSQGHRRIGMIGSNDIYACSLRRLEAFVKAMRRNGLEADLNAIYSGNGFYRSGAEAFERCSVLVQKPTAVIGVNDQVAAGFIQAARKRGVNVPEEISVCGIDGIDDLAEFMEITTVRQDYNTIAERTFRYLTDPERQKGVVEIRLPVDLIPGRTTGSCSGKKENPGS